MNREEQIIKASQLYAKHQQKPFMDGARWADKHPQADIEDICKNYEDWNKARMQELIAKACEWIINYNPSDYLKEIADFGEYELNEEKVINEFKRVMEL